MDRESLDIVMDTIQKTFNLYPYIADEPIEVGYAWNGLRRQYDAEEILNRCLMENKERPILVIVNDDIYVEGLNFVFGVAQCGGGAVIGLERFRYGGDPRDFRNRLSKTVKHELGHVFGLSHCREACVMRFANSLWELDRKPPDFCDNCKNKLRILGVLKD